jgi:hypothetical protein
LTLPNAVSSVGQGIFFDASGVATFRYPAKFTAAKTANYTATGDETIIPCTPATSFTVTLPAASTMSGKRLTIYRTDNDLTKTVTIDGNASETINGALTVVLYTQNESYTLECDGSNWIIVNHYAKTSPVSLGVVTIGAVTTPPTKGSVQTVDRMIWSRDGAFMEFSYFFRQSNATGSAAGSGVYLWTVPGGQSIDTTLFYGSTVTTDNVGICGVGSVRDDTRSYIADVVVYDATRVYIRATSTTADSSAVASSAAPVTQTNASYSFTCRVPISGWTA